MKKINIIGRLFFIWYDSSAFTVFAFGYVVAVKDTRKVPLLFSERNNLGNKKRLKIWHYFIEISKQAPGVKNPAHKNKDNG